MLTRKLNEVSLSGINANNATFFSPMLSNSISSILVIFASSIRLNFSSLEDKVIWIDFKVFAEPLR